MKADQTTKGSLVAATANVVAAQVGSNSTALGDVATLIEGVHKAFADIVLRGRQHAAPTAPVPAVPIRSSVKHDYIICLEDGRKLKMLKVHLRRRLKMTPAEYRAKWGLPADYPMVAPGYSEQRRSIAKSLGLGRGSKKD